MVFSTGCGELSTNTEPCSASCFKHIEIHKPARTVFTRLLSGSEVPEVIHTDKLCSDGAAIRELSVLHGVKDVQVTSSARRNNPVEQSHRLTRRQERQPRGFKRRRAQELLAPHARVSNLHRHVHTTGPARSDAAP
ncbi:hypothetical protein GCM10008949_39950 [Deinococcus humi]|nr:hypothetical protein GCM10008949_39950 [Deinococcus humi]